MNLSARNAKAMREGQRRLDTATPDDGAPSLNDCHRCGGYLKAHDCSDDSGEQWVWTCPVCDGPDPYEAVDLERADTERAPAQDGGGK